MNGACKRRRLVFDLCNWSRVGKNEYRYLIMKTKIAVFLFLAVLVALPVTSHNAWAKSKKKKKEKEFVPSPTPTPPGPPSGDLSSFVSSQGAKIFAPLEQKVAMPRAELAQLRNSFAQRFARASLNERTQFQAALTICDALTQVMNERDKFALAPSANWPARSAQLRQYIDQLIAREREMETQAGPASSPAH
jgi:hypothetical protein